MNKFDVVVVGGGPGGLSAALNSALEGFSTLVIERERWGGRAAQSAHIDNVLGCQGTGPEFAEKGVRHAMDMGVEFKIGDVAVLTHQRIIGLTSGEVIEAQRVILATGLSWRRLDIPGLEEAIEAGAARYGCDMERAREVAGRRVAVLGGANSAGINSLHFVDVGASHVDMLVRHNLDGMSTYLRKRLMHAPRVEMVHGGEELVGVERNNGILRLFTTRREVFVDRLFLFPGAKPQVPFAEMARDHYGFLRADMLTFETSMRGVYAVGDIRSGSVKRIATAIGEGAAAVLHVKKSFERKALCAA